MTQQEYEQKRLEGWEVFRHYNPGYDYPYCHRIYEIGFDRAAAIFSKESNHGKEAPNEKV